MSEESRTQVVVTPMDVSDVGICENFSNWRISRRLDLNSKKRETNQRLFAGPMPKLADAEWYAIR